METRCLGLTLGVRRDDHSMYMVVSHDTDGCLVYLYGLYGLIAAATNIINVDYGAVLVSNRQLGLGIAFL